MEKINKNRTYQKMNENRKSKRTFEQACKECHAIPHEVFAKLLLQGIENYYKNENL